MALTKEKRIGKPMRVFIVISIILILIILTVKFVKYHKSDQFLIDVVEERYSVEIVKIRRLDLSLPWLGHANNEQFLCVYPKGGNGETDEFTIYRAPKQNIFDKSKVYDTYFSIYLRDDYKDFAEEYVKKYFNEYKIFMSYSPSCIPKDASKKVMTLQEMFELNKTQTCGFSIFVYIPERECTEGEADEKFKLLYDDLKNHDAAGNLRVRITTNQDFDNVSTNKIGDYKVLNSLTEYFEEE